MRAVRRRHEITRLEAFSDAIFGFAATLLVVSLDVPTEFSEMRRALNGFVPFALTFGTLVTLWTVHNAFFRRYALDDRRTVVLNAVLLFVILFYVYPLKFLAAGLMTVVAGRWLGPLISNMTPGELGTMFMIYNLGWSAVFGCVALLYRHAWQQREVLGLDAVAVAEARALQGHYQIFVAVGVVAAGVAASGIGASFGLSGLMYGLLGPLCYWHWARVAPAALPNPASAAASDTRPPLAG